MNKYKYILKIILIALLYYIVAKVSLLLAFEETNSSPVWPPTGLALAVTFIYGYKIWPGITIGAFVANLVTFLSNNVLLQTSIATSLGISIGNTFEAIVGVYFLREIFKIESPFNSARNIFAFVLLAAFTATLISASVGAANLHLWGIVDRNNLLYVWWTWWNGDILGALVFTPFILVWYQKKISKLTLKFIPEAILMFALIIVTTYIIFTSKTIGSYGVPVHLEYLIIPLLLWAAFRFGQRGTTSAIFIITIMSVWYTAQGAGPYSVFPENNALLYLQSFLVVLVITFLAISAVLEERKDAKKELKSAHDDLEIKIDERTNELIKLNKNLQNEIKERKETEIELSKIAETQEVLLQEVNHRVKNNLSVLISIIHKEEEKIINDPKRDYTSILEDTVVRIKGLSIVHSLLSANKWQPLLISSLCEELINNIHRQSRNLPHFELKMQPSEIKINSNQAHHITLVINELCSNSIKHSITDKSDSKIEVNFKMEGNQLIIVYRDFGMGYPQEIIDRDSSHFKTGLDIVKGIVEQSLDGEVIFYNQNGAVTEIKFVKENSTGEL